MDKPKKLPKARCIICKNAVLIEGINVYCPTLIKLCDRWCSVGGFIGKPDRCKFFEESKDEN